MEAGVLITRMKYVLCAVALTALAASAGDEWKQFRGADFKKLASMMAQKIVFDGRNVWEPERMRRLGFEYHSIGRKSILPQP